MDAIIYLVQQPLELGWAAYRGHDCLGRFPSPETAVQMLRRQSPVFAADCDIVVCDRHDCWFAVPVEGLAEHAAPLREGGEKLRPM